MNLGELIDTLKAMPPKATVVVDHPSAHPRLLESYRGYYDQLSIDPTGRDVVPVKDLLRHAETAVGKTFTGYKGGEYEMSEKTLVWVAPHGETSDRLLGGAYISDDGTVVLTTTEGW